MSDRLDGPYRSLGDREFVPTSKNIYSLGMFPAQRVKTDVTTGTSEGYEDDRIHLRVDLEQG